VRERNAMTRELKIRILCSLPSLFLLGLRLFPWYKDSLVQDYWVTIIATCIVASILTYILTKVILHISRPQERLSRIIKRDEVYCSPLVREG